MLFRSKKFFLFSHKIIFLFLFCFCNNTLKLAMVSSVLPDFDITILRFFSLVAPSSLAPFEYLGIPSSFILGWIFFNEAPLDQLFPGVIGIIAAGMIVIWRDRKLSEFPEKTKKIY